MKKVYAHDGTRAFCHLGRAQVRMGHFYSTVVGRKRLLPLRKSKWTQRAVNGQSAACEGEAKKVVLLRQTRRICRILWEILL
ncbi:MAG: hypothetical protein ACFNO3_01650 [Alloprevotella tannerae]